MISGRNDAKQGLPVKVFPISALNPTILPSKTLTWMPAYNASLRSRENPPSLGLNIFLQRVEGDDVQEGEEKRQIGTRSQLNERPAGRKRIVARWQVMLESRSCVSRFSLKCWAHDLILSPPPASRDLSAKRWPLLLESDLIVCIVSCSPSTLCLLCLEVEFLLCFLHFFALHFLPPTSAL